MKLEEKNMKNLEDPLGFAKLKEVYGKKILNTRRWKWKSMPSRSRLRRTSNDEDDSSTIKDSLKKNR